MLVFGRGKLGIFIESSKRWVYFQVEEEYLSVRRFPEAVVLKKKWPPPDKQSLSRYFFSSKNLLYLHNCRHDVRRHIREAKCVDIRHKTTCRVKIDTCPLLSFLLYRTSQIAQIWNKPRHTRNSRNKTGKNQQHQQKNKQKIPVSFSINRLLNSSEREKCHVSHLNLVDVLSTGRTRGVAKMIEIHWHTKSHLSHQIKEKSPDNFKECRWTNTKLKCIKTLWYYCLLLPVRPSMTPAFETDAERVLRTPLGSAAILYQSLL